MAKNKKAIYTLYKLDEFGEDFQNVWEYYNITDLLEDTKRHDIKLELKHSIYKYIFKDSDNVKKLLNDKYFIIKEV